MQLWSVSNTAVAYTCSRSPCRGCAGETAGPAYHVGDTPYDVQAGQAAGAHAIGVLTGVHTRADLTAPGVGASWLGLSLTHCLLCCCDRSLGKHLGFSLTQPVRVQSALSWRT